MLDVLPIRLGDPPFSLGFNYSNPKDPAALKAHLADMRAHGMTCVAPLYDWRMPIHDEDTSELGALLKAYKQAGFPGVFYFATPMNLQLSALAGYGDETSKRWQQKYIQVMRRLHAETLKHDVPVVPAYGWRDGKRFLHHVRFEPAFQLIRTGNHKADVLANTAMFTQRIEEYVLRHPEQWFWLHRRWRRRP